jgi:hypothetical protein
VTRKKLHQLKCKTVIIVSAAFVFGDAANFGIVGAASDVITFHHVLDGSPLDASAKARRSILRSSRKIS